VYALLQRVASTAAVSVAIVEVDDVALAVDVVPGAVDPIAVGKKGCHESPKRFLTPFLC